jgi:hypothetical protein
LQISQELQIKIYLKKISGPTNSTGFIVNTLYNPISGEIVPLKKTARFALSEDIDLDVHKVRIVKENNG